MAKTETLTVDFTKNPKDGDAFDVGSVEFEIGAIDVKMNGEALPMESFLYIFGYGAKQSGQDAYAGETDFAGCNGALNKRVDAWAEGNPPTRGGGIATDKTIARQLVWKALEAKMSDTDKKAWKDASQADKNAHADKAIAKMDADGLAKAVKAERDRREAERKAKAEAKAKAASLLGDIDLSDL